MNPRFCRILESKIWIFDNERNFAHQVLLLNNHMKHNNLYVCETSKNLPILRYFIWIRSWKNPSLTCLFSVKMIFIFTIKWNNTHRNFSLHFHFVYPASTCDFYLFPINIRKFWKEMFGMNHMICKSECLWRQGLFLNRRILNDFWTNKKLT